MLLARPVPAFALQPSRRMASSRTRLVKPLAMVADKKNQTRTCRRCKQQFDPSENHPQACRYHTAMWTGGEISKAIGFCRASGAPEDQLISVVGRTGLIRFWDCCGAETEDAPGCCYGPHVAYGDPE